MASPALVALVPLLPEFLLVRRRSVDFIQRSMDRHGVDRPALMLVIGRELTGDWHTLDETRSPYATTSEPQLAAAEAARGAKLVTEWLGRWALTDQGRRLCADLRTAAHAALAKLEPVPAAELAELAELLERGFEANATAPEPARRDYLPRTLRFRGGVAAAHPLVALENAVHGLWAERDDCHVAAWRAAGLDGPAHDALTRIWRGEAATREALRERLTGQRPADFAASVARLQDAGLVAGDATLTLTGEGKRVREAIEAETDRLFFTWWPEEVAARGPWLRETLAKVNAAL